MNDNVTGKVKQNNPLDELNRQTLDAQFCSDWLKGKISELFDQVDELKQDVARYQDRNKVLEDRVKFLSRLLEGDLS